MSTDKKSTKIMAHTFFAQLQAGGYTNNQILDIAAELIDQVTCNMKDGKVHAAATAQAAQESARVSA
ncbi:MAG: hypothetical protein ACO1OB_15720 [Archangium sp.]